MEQDRKGADRQDVFAHGPLLETAERPKPLKPIMKYPGGKARELKYILPFAPCGTERFFEPFVGGGAVYFSFRDAGQYFVNDISKELTAVYRAVKEVEPGFFRTLHRLNEDWKMLSAAGLGFDSEVETRELSKGLAILGEYGLEGFFSGYLLRMKRQKGLYIQKQREKGNSITAEDTQEMFETVLKASYYAAVRKAYNDNRKNGGIQDNAAFYFFIREFCFSSMFRFAQNGDFNVPYGGKSYNSKSFDGKIKYLRSPELVSHLANTEIYNMDFQEFAQMFSFSGSDFIFVDPPYDTEFSTYDENEFGRQDQIRLAAFLRSVEAKWMLVIKDTPFIRSLYPQEDAHIFYREYGKNYSVSFMNRNNKNVNHLMITNYEV